MNVIVCPPAGTVEPSLITELNQVKLLAEILVPLKSDAIALVVVQATEAFAGTLNNARSKIVGKITSEIRYRVSKLGTFRNASLRHS